MLRLLRPPAAPAGPLPSFGGPDDVISWARELTFLGTGTWNLHLDPAFRLTCVGVAGDAYRAGYDARPIGDDVAACGATWVLQLCGKRRAKVVSDADRKTHLRLWSELARLGVNLVDTVFVWPDGGASVTGASTYVGAPDDVGLSVHIPPRAAQPAWSPPVPHVEAGSLSGPIRRALSIVDDLDLDVGDDDGYEAWR